MGSAGTRLCPVVHRLSPGTAGPCLMCGWGRILKVLQVFLAERRVGAAPRSDTRYTEHPRGTDKTLPPPNAAAPGPQETGLS